MILFMSIISTSYLPIVNGFFFSLYYLEIPFFEQFKVQKDKPWPWHKEPERWRWILVRAFQRAFFNSTGMIQFGLAVLCYFYNWQVPWTFRIDVTKDELPTIKEILPQIYFLVFCEDFCFYWSHRLLHHKSIYKYIHKAHHEINHIVSVAALSCHPLEFLICDLWAPFSGIILLGSKCHAMTIILYHAWRMFEGHEIHCGYDFPWSVFRLVPT